ncbi:MAG: HAMP domain-containing histidine kinase [Lachnospiraceae bacterium]|nr:HAMP domain-containing histidine kinase [Lachnospiraceae bacterium]
MSRVLVRKILLHISVHLCAFMAFILAADILFGSYVSVDYIEDTEKYILDPFPMSEDELDRIVTDIFAHQASDIMRYTAACRILRVSNGIEVNRMVDISDYYTGASKIKIKYSVSDLINYGRRGVSYIEKNYSITDFVYHYGDPLFVQNFDLDEYGNLYFKGFGTVNKNRDTESFATEEEDIILGEGDKKIMNAMNELEPADLMHLVVEYCIRHYPDDISMTVWDDGMVYVTVREPNLEGDSGTNLEDNDVIRNWDSYFVVIDELKSAATLFSSCYDIYRDGQTLYDSDKMNLFYHIKTTDSLGISHVYTNDQESKKYDDTELTDIYSGHKHYLICYYDDLEYSTLSDISESVITDVIKAFPTVYPDSTCVWMYLDDNFSKAEDIYYNVSYKYNDVKQLSRLYALLITVFALLWLLSFSYLVFITGVVERDGREEYILLPQDRVWIELLILLTYAFFVLFRYYTKYLGDILDDNLSEFSSLGDKLIKDSGISSYVVFGLFGLSVSLALSFIIFSVVRRIRAGVLYEYSFTRKVRQLFEWFALSLSGGTGAAATVLLPYVLFLGANFGGMFLILHLVNSKVYVSAILVGGLLLFLDVSVGITMFLVTAEKKQLLDGIARIRGGETDYKINVKNLRAENRNLAESINNIGEGIKQAVDDSIVEEHLRTELITNVSHDLKTPLTSIINYSDLLKRENLTEEQKKEYLKVITDKSIKLKKLLEDLLEASKLSSGKIEIIKARTNLTELINQALGEYEGRFKEKNLDVVTNVFPRVLVFADAACMWRVLDNLFENICKYAMSGTRVYFELIAFNGEVEIKVKNVSRAKPEFQGYELTERFIRGDQSRSGEGSGLGLFIAKSLIEAHNGKFEVVVDGDQFTTIITMKELGSDTTDWDYIYGDDLS